uniref:TniQ n=5 Tax=Enterobacteriaceae TaxID=543 RepID=A0A0G3B370_ENTCL|nr:TniQ [Enterobacter cloacae]
MISLSPPTICNSAISTMLNTRVGSVAKIVKLEHAWRRLDGRNDDGFQVAPFPG